MSLHEGIDTVSWVSLGLYSKTYGDGEQANLNSLFVSLGLLETATSVSIGGGGSGLWGLGMGMSMDM